MRNMLGGCDKIYDWGNRSVKEMSPLQKKKSFSVEGCLTSNFDASKLGVGYDENLERGGAGVHLMCV